MILIATFYTHFGAIRFKRQCEQKGYPAKLMPVPRNLSSSCGTCVRFEGACPDDPEEDVEQIVAVEDAGYTPLYRAENS